MSIAQIMAELPKLNREQRAKISLKLRELEERDELQFMTEAAEIAFVELDRREANDAKRNPRTAGRVRTDANLGACRRHA